jgi:hypothetical protein
LGLGTAATQNSGTSGATVPLLNGANSWSAGQSFAAVAQFSAGLTSRSGSGVQINNAANSLGLLINNDGTNFTFSSGGTFSGNLRARVLQGIAAANPTSAAGVTQLHLGEATFNPNYGIRKEMY